MKLILCRHGQTEDNKNGLLQGHKDSVLSKEGIEQAKKLAIRLREEKIDAIFSSDLKRAADTAKEIARHHPNAVIITDERLRECFMGRYQGKARDSVDWDNRPEEIETMESMIRRSKEVLDMAYEKYPNSAVCFVTHAGICLALSKIILNRTDDRTYYKQKNTALSIFEIREDKNHVVHLMNCSKHLDD